jgi:predicted outer membrane repeat protein
VHPAQLWIRPRGGHGGAISNRFLGGIVTMTNLTMTNNVASTLGGGIAAVGFTAVDTTLVSHNAPTGAHLDVSSRGP